MKENKRKANDNYITEKASKSTKDPHTERKVPNPPVPNRAHTEMKKGGNK